MSSHADLVRVVQRWLRVERKHVPVLAEPSTHRHVEEPDVIGWLGHRSSVVECKVSRADFLADKRKPFRSKPELGMGVERWYAAPPGIIRASELPPRWGLIEVDFARNDRVRIVLAPSSHTARNVDGENAFLVSAYRRLLEGWGQKSFGDDAQTTAEHPRTARRKAREARTKDAIVSKVAEAKAPAGGGGKAAFNALFPKIPVRRPVR